MNQKMDTQLVYRPVQSFTLPAELEAWTQVRICPREVLDPTAEFLSVRRRIDGQRLQIRGELLIKGTLALPKGQLQTLNKTSSFGLDFYLPEPILPGHVVIGPQVAGLTYTINRVGRKQAEVKFLIASAFKVKVMAVQPYETAALLSHCHFKPVFLSVVLTTQAESFQRELLLPLDPPARKIVRADIAEPEVQVDWAQPLVVSGIAKEEILYLGTDGHVHELCHTTAWNYLWPLELKETTGKLVVSAQGDIIRADILSFGHTLSLSIRETVDLQACQERKQDILIADDTSSVDQVLWARVPLILAEHNYNELVPVCLPLKEQPTMPSQPQVKATNLSGRADHGQVILQGQLEIAFPYVDQQGRERLQHFTAPFTKVLIMDMSRPGQLVQIEGCVENVRSTLLESGSLDNQILCAFHVRLLSLERVALVAGPTLSKIRSCTQQAWVEELVGQQHYNMLIEEILAWSDQEGLILDYNVQPRVHGAHVGYGVLFCHGEIQASIYYLSISQEECCREFSLPWQATLSIPAAVPGLISEVDIEASLLPLSVAKDGSPVVLRAACAIKGWVYRSAVVPVITELLPAKEEVDCPVIAVINQEAELEVLIKPRRWWPGYETTVTAEVKAVHWQIGLEEVVGMGELSLTVTYAAPQGSLQRWDEVRPFELTFVCPKAQPGRRICGNLEVKEILRQEAMKKDAPGRTPQGRYIRVSVVLMADLVLL